jgi:hypothetical protein
MKLLMNQICILVVRDRSKQTISEAVRFIYRDNHEKNALMSNTEFKLCLLFTFIRGGISHSS